ncbi:carbohydrate ABC transporter permease [Cohnella nanjingensis]|uniref:Carbohydrate ABC transporter permease n=1 Tax=Cohnella nanjingensis TaxID=1387779 RepID=A0A7X0RVH5_9BACL|nr:carbohydrate ABC transporter permease [Cohnella nanjingensis]MBB6674429.1 carbohydrate ABC transporter permease [Cohnella nanjingensis]
MRVRASGADRAFAIVVYGLVLAASALALFPMLYVLAISFSTETEYLTRGFYLLPRTFTLEGYLYLMSHPGFMSALRNSVTISVVGTLINIALTTLMAYGLSKTWLRGRKTLHFIVFFTLLFSGGIIPTYLVVQALGLLDSFWAVWLTSAVSAFNAIVMRSFFQAVPIELEESARIDGSGEWRLLFNIIVPLSFPAIATFTLFYLAQNWNTYFSAILYLDNDQMPLQVFLKQMLVEDDPSISNASSVAYHYTPAARMSAIVLTALPLLLIFPFLQRYFNQGVMLGAVKG